MLIEAGGCPGHCRASLSATKERAVTGTASILAFSGSTREASANKKVLAIAVAAAREAGAEVTVVDLRDYPLPVYDGDLEAE
ncbi:MAG: NADPH-dependent FMN reductase, partial [Pseudomonadales bacterium]